MPRRNVNEHATAETRRKGAEKAAEAKRAKKEAERALLSEMRQTHLDAAVSKLSELAERAAAAIEALLEADSESVRLRAALETIRLLIDVEVIEMSDRLSRLEELAQSRNGSR